MGTTEKLAQSRKVAKSQVPDRSRSPLRLRDFARVFRNRIENDPSMMQPRALVVAAALALVGCDRGAPAPPSPASAAAAPSAVAPTRATLTLDAAHDVMTKKDAPAYTIPPCAELVLEVGEHRFPIRDAGPLAPDSVHVVHGASGYHRASFSGHRVVLSAASLDPVKGGVFPGFEAGESYIVALGAEAPSTRDGAMGFAPLWTAKIDVAPK
jgi:hypothetical protein